MKRGRACGCADSQALPSHHPARISHSSEQIAARNAANETAGRGVKDGSCCMVPRGGLGFWRLHGPWGGSSGVEQGDLSLELDLSPAPVSKKLSEKGERAE